MALRNVITGEYYKVIIRDDEPMIEKDRVLIRIFENETYRDEVRNNNDTDIPFRISIFYHITLNKDIRQILLEASWNISENLISNYLTAIYNYLKTLPEYVNFVDC